MATIEASPKKQEAEELLRTAYNSAFTEWVTEVTLLNAYSADPTSSVERIARANERAQKAQRAYREQRNALLRQMRSRGR